MLKIVEPRGYDGKTAAVVRGLPGHYYTDPAIFEAEKRKIFFRTWQCLGHVCMLPEKTSYFTASVVDQDVAVIRGEDGEIRAFFNIQSNFFNRFIRISWIHLVGFLITFA